MSEERIPDDIAARWIFTSWSLQRAASDLHVALATYPAPACYAIARQYDQALEELLARDAFGAAPAPAKRKQQQQLELWQDD
jgi:hypothetical protein